MSMISIIALSGDTEPGLLSPNIFYLLVKTARLSDQRFFNSGFLDSFIKDLIKYYKLVIEKIDNSKLNIISKGGKDESQRV